MGAATGAFWLARQTLGLDKGQASLLYLPLVILLAIRLGFGPATLAAGLSFLCWDFFFLPPYGTLIVRDPRDWLSLGVFLLAAVTTARLAAQARQQTAQAQAREAEAAMLLRASEAVAQEVSAPATLLALTDQLRSLCGSRVCLVFRLRPDGALEPFPRRPDAVHEALLGLAGTALEHCRTLGFDDQPLWRKAVGGQQDEIGAFVPLLAAGERFGVLYAGPRTDGQAFSASDRRLILTLAHHAATVLARAALAEAAIQAEALREAEALKDSLLSLVSHELRTPLAAIKAVSSGLLQTGSEWTEIDRRAAVESLDSEADRLTAVVSNLLDLSRIEGGAWTPVREPCDLAEIAGTALDRLPPDAAARVLLETPDEIPWVPADYLQIALVIENLLRNAVKYAPDGPIELRVVETPDGVSLTVRDHGPGLRPEEIEALFERFYRGKDHRASRTHGTGLGMTLCRAVLTAHGGSVRAANAPGGGAVFTLTLPRS